VGVNCTGRGQRLWHFFDETVYRGYPRELIDAARIDGSSSWYLCSHYFAANGYGPGYAGIFQFMGTWNDTFAAYRDYHTERRTLPIMLTGTTPLTALATT